MGYWFKRRAWEDIEACLHLFLRPAQRAQQMQQK
jgi:hypothetical protein